MGSATITDTYRRDARLYSGLDVLTSTPRSSEATFPFTSCCIASSISGSGVEAVLGAGCGADLVVVAGAPLAVLELRVAGAAVAVLAGAVLRVRVAAVVAVLASSGPAPALAFFAEEEATAPAVLVDAARVVFFAAGVALSAGPVAAGTVASDFFLGVLAGAAPAVLFVLIFFFGTLAAAVLAALDGFAAVDARRSGVCGLQVGMVVMHRAHRPRRCGFRTREDIVWSGCSFGLGLHSCCNWNRRAPLLSSCRDQSEKSRLEGYG
jgi:hypothetical protein